MPYAPLLTEVELTEGLAALPEWRRDGDSILRTIRCATFPEAIELVTRVAAAAEAADHHPDILINYKRVTLMYSTHDAGGITEKDFTGAAMADRVANQT